MEKERPFHGRRHELRILQSLLQKKTASLVVVRGRRRIGKSRLIQEFGNLFDNAYYFSGIAPTKETTAITQREEFSRQLTRVMNLPLVKADDWGDMLWFMANQVKSGRVLVVLDEITWMGGMDHTFLSKLQNIWDQHFKNNAQLVLVLCSSVSAWIEDNIINNTGFVGRVSYDLQLTELPLDVCLEFWRNNNNYISPYEIFKVLAITGGIPWYLEHIDPKKTAEENINQLAFMKEGILFREYDRIFADIFGKRSDLYSKIVQSLVKGPTTQNKIIEKLDKTKSGYISEYLDNLIESGFITRDYTWHLSNGALSKLSHYRLSDNYVRFYLKYIEPNKSKIIRGDFRDVSLSSLSGWYSMLGLQFENLILNNRQIVKKTLGIRAEDIIYDNPYFQTKTQRQRACQIDYMIQTRTNNCYICEIKFSKETIKSKVIDEVTAKIEKVKMPPGYTIRPVLICVNGVEQTVIHSDFFVKIITIDDLISF